MSKQKNEAIPKTLEDRRLWLGNLDTRITEFQLLKIVQKCGAIEKFDMIFHKSGPLVGQPRGYAFVTFEKPNSATIAINKLNGKLIGCRNMVVRMAKNIAYDELDRTKSKVEIPALAAGASTSGKMSKEFTIQAIEEKLRALESKKDDFEVNRSTSTTNEVPLIQRYQYNKNSERSGSSQHSTKLSLTRHKHSGPYDRRPRHHRR